MDAIGNGCWGLWKWNPLPQSRRRRVRRNSGSAGATGGGGYRFPVKQALTAASLALTGDTIAQLSNRWKKAKEGGDNISQDELWSHLSDHDWLRALRMTSYGLLLYGPGSYAWYQCLDHFLPKPTVQNLMLKVLLNQIVLGPCVIAVVFAWNNLWQRRLSELPEKYRRDALPTLLYGFRFWIPVSVLNFWQTFESHSVTTAEPRSSTFFSLGEASGCWAKRVVPLQTRVAFMSMGSIFWNFYLSSTMTK